jgi:hypothetical protein
VADNAVRPSAVRRTPYAASHVRYSVHRTTTKSSIEDVTDTTTTLLEVANRTNRPTDQPINRSTDQPRTIRILPPSLATANDRGTHPTPGSESISKGCKLQWWRIRGPSGALIGRWRVMTVPHSILTIPSGPEKVKDGMGQEDSYWVKPRGNGEQFDCRVRCIKIFAGRLL